jgi:hypothetical protein
MQAVLTSDVSFTTLSNKSIFLSAGERVLVDPNEGVIQWQGHLVSVDVSQYELLN